MPSQTQNPQDIHHQRRAPALAKLLAAYTKFDEINAKWRGSLTASCADLSSSSSQPTVSQGSPLFPTSANAN